MCLSSPYIYWEEFVKDWYKFFFKFLVKFISKASEQKSKNPQQNISKPNSAVYWKYHNTMVKWDLSW